jgi:hypothetical protein
VGGSNYVAMGVNVARGTLLEREGAYRRHDATKTWRREVKDRDAEEAWLMTNVYAPAFGPRCAAPRRRFTR